MENFFPRFLQGLIIISLIGLAMTFFFEGKYELPMGVSGIELFIDKQKEAKEKVVNSDDKQLVQKPDWKLGKEFFENKNWLELERHSKFLIQEKGKNAVINHIHYFLSLLFQGKQHEAKEYLNAEGNRKWKFSENYDFEYVVYSVLKFYR
jgi:uncharacterized membrane protein YraQ (UPF0718 family)